MCSSDTQKIRQAWNMAISFRGRVVPLHVTKSLSNACMPHQNHKKRTAHQHSRLSTQTNYQSNHYTCRQSHACNTTGHKRNQETGRHQKFARSMRPPTTCQWCKRLSTKHRSSQHSTSSKGETRATSNWKWKTIGQLRNEAITPKGEPQPTLNQKQKTIRWLLNEAITSKGEPTNNMWQNAT